MSGRKKDSRLPQGKKPLTHGWIVVPSKTYPDRVYFYNTVTKCSTWDNPCEDKTDTENINSSSESTSPERNWSVKKKQKSFHISRSKKRKEDVTLTQPDKNFNVRINSRIEDYDDQDQFFNNIPTRAFSVPNSHTVSPSRSPSSTSSSTLSQNLSDSEKQSDSNSLLENNKEELWVHFVSSPEKSRMKKSVALSDFQEPSTSQNLEMEMKSNDKRTSTLTMGNGQSFSKNVDKKKKKKKKRSLSEKNTLSGNIKKSVVFKKRDKTPAQTRLLNLRAQNAKMLQELAAKELEIPGAAGNQRKSKNTGILNLRGSNEKNFVKRVESGLGTAPETGNCSVVDFTEEMDWEPSSEESDVRNINVFRQQLERPSEISNEIFFNSDHSFELPYKTYLWFLVLDTNIFVSCLSFIKQLRDTKVCDLGYPFIYVPWRVLQELDHLKDTKIQPLHRDLQANVRRAISYLNENFKVRHPRIFGQSFEDFMKMVDFEVSAPDDEILQTCIKLQKEHSDKKVMLLTNDKNLESKAIVSNVEVYSKDSFHKKFLRSRSPASRPNKNVKNFSNGDLKADSCLCEAKDAFKDFLSSVVETEMKIAFEGDWIKLAAKKPPWSLKDAMDCLLKHWRSVFFVNFPKETHLEAELLYERLLKKEAVGTGEVINIISSMQRLILSIEKSQKQKRPYSDLIPTTLTKLSKVLKILSPDYCPEVEISASSSPPPGSSSVNDSLESRQIPPSETSINEISKVKILFKDIWDSLRLFCCSLSDVIHSSDGNDAVIQEMRLKLSQTSNEVEELVATVERILEINLSDINEGHASIIYLSNFLIHVHPNMLPDLKNELPKCLATFFADFEARSLLSRALLDFKEFIQDLVQAAEYFNAQKS